MSDNSSMNDEVTREILLLLSRKNAIEILNQLMEVNPGSKYDLRKQLADKGVKMSYATVLNYINKFLELGLIYQSDVVPAKRGGSKIVYRPTPKAREFLSKIESSKKETDFSQPTEGDLPFGLYSLGLPGLPDTKPKTGQKKEIQKILEIMQIDIAVVINYNKYPIPVTPISTIGGIDYASRIFSKELSEKVISTAIKVAQNIIEQKNSAKDSQ